MDSSHSTLSTETGLTSRFGYEILQQVGVGAGSTIYAADDPQTRQLVALKHVRPADAKGQRYVEQLQTEYEVGRRTSHAGLRRSLDLKLQRSWCHTITEAVLVMEFVDGISLEELRPIGQLATVACFLQVASALDALHADGQVHCDLKPGNILRDDAGRVKVIDLGQACPIGTVKPRIQGTPDYIAPEQVRHDAVTPQTDVYNFGATMYNVLTGMKLPTAYTVKESSTSFLLDVAVPSPHDLDPTVLPCLSTLVMECVRTRVDKRPASMAEVIRRLQVIQFKLKRE